jgi:hypothetical protein
MADLRAQAGALEQIARRHGIVNLRVFGSVARGTADARSDLDLLVEVLAGHGLFELGAFAAEVDELVGVPVQVATVNGLKPQIRERVVAEAVAPVRRDVERLQDILEPARRIDIRGQVRCAPTAKPSSGVVSNRRHAQPRHSRLLRRRSRSCLAAANEVPTLADQVAAIAAEINKGATDGHE